VNKNIDQPMNETLVQAQHPTFCNRFCTNVCQPMWLHHGNLTLTFDPRDFRTELHTLSNNLD